MFQCTFIAAQYAVAIFVFCIYGRAETQPWNRARSP